MPAIFMMQNLPAGQDRNQQLLCFYDSGCGGARLSDRAYKLIRTMTIRTGPTVLDVAGGKSIEIPYGDEQFSLELEGGNQVATVTGLRMPYITTSFPLIRLHEAWQDLVKVATAAGQTTTLPAVDDEIGGSPVDVIIGIRYLKYFPSLVFSLPSGLAIYCAKFRSASGRQAGLGGPHTAWAEAATRAGHMNPRAYLTSEARAWCVEHTWVRLNQFGGCRGFVEEVDSHSCPAAEESRMFTAAGVVKKERWFWQAEGVGADSPYRCIECRQCQKCRNGDELEAASFNEEAEQPI